MDQIILKATVYGCGTCGYYQDFNSVDNPLQHQSIFPTVPAGKCPACFAGQNPQRQRIECDLEAISTSAEIMTTVEFASDQELESRTEELRDEHGNVVMEQTGEHYEMRVNPVTGEVYSELVPDHTSKLQQISDKELADLKEQRDRNLDALETIAVKEL